MDYIQPKRIFEDSGTVDPATGYFVELENVVNQKNQDLLTMVNTGRYFSIFAPRQSGKTTYFDTFCRNLENDIKYITIQLSFENYEQLNKKKFYKELQKNINTILIQRLKNTGFNELKKIDDFINQYTITDNVDFSNYFVKLNKLLPEKRIVIFIDEFDGIPNDELKGFLTTLRSLYQQYKRKTSKALYSVCLVGIRNIPKLIIGGVSPFNIADQVKLPLFSLKNIQDLFAQYTEETNQPFTEEAVLKVYVETTGQPWLVNRLGSILTINIKPNTVNPITEKDVEKAINQLIYEENNHFDNITEKAKQCKETFISIVFNGVDYRPGNEEQSLLLTHGLIKEKNTKAVVSNSIYSKRFAKTFLDEAEAKADLSDKAYYTQDGQLDFENIMHDFDEYIARIGVNSFYQSDKTLEKTGQYLLTAWLYQFTEGGKGELHYETPTGLGRMDIMLKYLDKKYIIETKINRYNLQTTLTKAIKQVADKYLKTEKANDGYIVIFDIKTMVGEPCNIAEHKAEGKTITSFNIAIGRPG